MAEHTPGPWKWGDPYWLVEENGKGVLDIGTLIPSEADGRLIAASPDLLAACEKQEELHAHRCHCWSCANRDKCSTGKALADEAYKLRKAAIAKALDN